MKISSFFLVLTFLISSCTKSISDKDLVKYTNQGLEIAQATQRTLGSSLSQKMKKGGTKEALPFCNTMAQPLTAQMIKKYDAGIKRTSLKIRNEINAPSKRETNILEKYQKLKNNNETLKPIVEKDNDGVVHFYSPIILQKKCLACHGTVGKEITKQSDSLIKAHYPNDLAIGYNEGDIRGIWSITFNNNTSEYD
jgi:hypothetical protein